MNEDGGVARKRAEVGELGVEWFRRRKNIGRREPVTESVCAHMYQCSKR